MFVTNWISTTKIQKISEITNFFRHYFLSRTEVILNTDNLTYAPLKQGGIGCCWYIKITFFLEWSLAGDNVGDALARVCCQVEPWLFQVNQESA